MIYVIFVRNDPFFIIVTVLASLLVRSFVFNSYQILQEATAWIWS